MKKIWLVIISTALFAGCNKTNNDTIDAKRQSFDINEISENYRNTLNNDEKNNLSFIEKIFKKREENIKENTENNVDINDTYEDSYTSTLLSEFTTNILTTDKNRYNNIKIVADRLNGYTLASNEVFSYNEVCGPYGKSDGFLEANILLSDGSHAKGYGGGVCQLSSTLYNAVKDLNVRILERHNHSVPVAYVPKNQDATVSLQSNLDFKFKNNYNNALRFETSSTPETLTVRVYEET